MKNLKPHEDPKKLHGKDHVTPEDYEKEFKPSMAALYEHNNEAHKVFDKEAQKKAEKPEENEKENEKPKLSEEELKRMEEAWVYMEEKRSI